MFDCAHNGGLGLDSGDFIDSRVAAATLAMLLSLTALAACKSPSRSASDPTAGGGPLVAAPAQAWVLPATKGRTFTDGSNVLDVRGSTPIKVVSVTSIGGTTSLQFLGAKVASPRRQYTTTNEFNGWPPRDIRASFVLDAGGQSVSPTAGNWHRQPYELLLGYRVISTDFAVRTAVRVVYESAGKTYQQDFPSLIAVCPPSEDLQKCGNQAFGGN